MAVAEEAVVVDFKPAPHRVYESMTRLVLETMRDRTVIRVWRDEPVFRAGPDQEVVDHCATMPARDPTDSFQTYAQVIVHHVAALPRIAAIEVLDANGNGGLLYPDWS